MWSSLYSTWIGSPAHDYIHVHSFSVLILQGQPKLLHGGVTPLDKNHNDSNYSSTLFIWAPFEHPHFLIFCIPRSTNTHIWNCCSLSTICLCHNLLCLGPSLSYLLSPVLIRTCSHLCSFDTHGSTVGWTVCGTFSQPPSGLLLRRN